MTKHKIGIESVDNLNSALVDIFDKITNTGAGASSTGNNFEQTIYTLLKSGLSGFVFVSNKQWRQKGGIFEEYAKRAMKNNFDFSDLLVPSDGKFVYNRIIVENPNSTQRWPDSLVIFNGIGLPIEIKSTKTDRIVWNGGLPRFDAIYIFNCWGIPRTTTFLGQDVITQEVRKILMDAERHEKALLNKVKTGDERWEYYSRPMYLGNEKYFKSELTVTQREERVKDFIINLPWNIYGQVVNFS